MGLRNSAIRGVVLNWIGQFGSLLITFFLTPFLVLTLGNETYGIWSLVMGLTGYYGVANAGLHDTATKFIVQFDSSGERRKVQNVISTLIAFYCLVALVVMAVAVCFAVLFPFVFEMAGNNAKSIRAVILILALNFAIHLIAKPFRSVLTSKVRFDLINALSFGSQLILALMFVVVLKSGGGLLAMAWATLGVGIITQAVQYWMATTILRMNLFSPAFVAGAMAKEIVSFGSGLFVSTGAMRIGNSSGVVIVGMLLGPAAAAFFSIGHSLISKSDILLQGIRSAVFPVVCRASSEQRDQELVRIALLVPRVLLAMSITMTIGVVVFGSPLMDLWIEPGYSDNVYELFCLLACGLTAQQLAGGHRSMLIAQARIRFLAWYNSIEAMLSIGLGAYLVSMFDLNGMGVALLFVGLVHGIVLSNYTCRLLGFRWETFVVRTVFPCVLSGLPTLIVALTLNVINPPINIWMLIIDILSVGFVGAVSLFFVCLTADVRSAVLHALFWKVGKKPAPSR